MDDQPVVVVDVVDVVFLFSRQKRPFLRVSGQTVVTYTLKRRKTIQMVKFSAQTDLFSAISDFVIKGIVCASRHPPRPLGGLEVLRPEGLDAGGIEC